MRRANDDYIRDAKSGLMAAKRLAAGLVKAPGNPTAISVPEVCAVQYILSRYRDKMHRIAELGTFTGHTANILAELSPEQSVIEIYDFFQHNEMSINHLKSHPKYSPDDFFEVWKYNTRNHTKKFNVHRGDLNENKSVEKSPLDLLFVDIVKHESLVNTVVNPFYDRLRIGGFLMHQDYYHWQSPWLVYQMEKLDNAFTLVGDFGNNMSVYVKRRALTKAEKNFDYIKDLNFKEKYELFDRAIARYPGLRAGNLMASKLRLTVEDEGFDSSALYLKILEEFTQNERITGYAKEIMRNKEDILGKMW
jgi:hypothetical protein